METTVVEVPTASFTWNDFLTQRDKTYLESTNWTKSEQYGLGQRPAVLVVDDYYAALGTERKPILESIKTWPKSCGEEGWEAIDRTVELLDAARAANVPIVYIKRLETFPATDKRVKKPLTDQVPASVRSRSEEIVDEIAPQIGDVVIEKAAPSAFFGTPLHALLTSWSIDTVLVCGESTSGCVRATVVDASSYRFQVGIVGDACFDRLQANHWINLFDMNQKYGDLIRTTEAITYIDALSPARN